MGNVISAQLIFEKTEPPKQEDIRIYIAYKKDGLLQGIQIPEVVDMTAGFVIAEQFRDCDISVYVWDRNMKPLMRQHKLNI